MPAGVLKCGSAASSRAACMPHVIAGHSQARGGLRHWLASASPSPSPLGPRSPSTSVCMRAVCRSHPTRACNCQQPAASSQQPVAHDLRVCDASRSPLEHSRPRPSPSPSPSPRPCPRRTRHGQPVDGRRYDTPSTGTGSSGWDAPPSPSLSLSLSLSLSPCAARASSSSSSPSPSPVVSRQPPVTSRESPAASCKRSQLPDTTASSRRSPDGAGARRAEDEAR